MSDWERYRAATSPAGMHWCSLRHIRSGRNEVNTHSCCRNCLCRSDSGAGFPEFAGMTLVRPILWRADYHSRFGWKSGRRSSKSLNAPEFPVQPDDVTSVCGRPPRNCNVRQIPLMSASSGTNLGPKKTGHGTRGSLPEDDEARPSSRRTLWTVLQRHRKFPHLGSAPDD